MGKRIHWSGSGMAVIRWQTVTQGQPGIKENPMWFLKPLSMIVTIRNKWNFSQMLDIVKRNL